MSLPNFSYLAPKTVDSLCTLLSQHARDAKVIAGGTDVVVQMKERKLTPSYLIDVKGIDALDYVRYEKESGLKIGALTTLRAMESSKEVQEHFPVLGHAAQKVGSVQIRNRATVTGNICNAAPGADMSPSLIALDATLVALNSKGERSIDINDFFVGPYKTSLESDELVTEIRVPPLPTATGVAYHKHSVRKAMDLALVGVAARISLDPETMCCTNVKIVLGAVAPTPMRARRAEQVLTGKELDKRLFAQAAKEAAGECQPRSSNRGSADYKRAMVEVFTRRMLEQASTLAVSDQSSDAGA